MRVINTNITCIKFKTSEKIKAAKIVAVRGCINRPMDPLEADIFPMPKVIRNCPPN
jgi:hypothetical protein